jgi:uncharacterized membrane protein YeaQ/YmgE (transglycosylase-associated protein family)
VVPGQSFDFAQDDNSSSRDRHSSVRNTLPGQGSKTFGRAGPADLILQGMLHLIWYVLIGFIAGCVAKALMHTHLSITWTIVLGIIGSILGGAVTHLFSPPSAGGRFHPGGIIVSIIGAIVVLYAWHKFRLHIPRA